MGNKKRFSYRIRWHRDGTYTKLMLHGQIKYQDYLAQRHGFKDSLDVQHQLRECILKMIQTRQSNPAHPNLSKMSILKSLYTEKLKQTKLHCACCDESHEEFLTLDHVKNNGAEHKRTIAKMGQHKNSHHYVSLYYYLLVYGFDASDYQILCYNCNSSLGNRGYCPHNPEIKREASWVKAHRIRSSKKMSIVEETEQEASLFDF